MKKPPPDDAGPLIPSSPTVPKLRAAAADCKACDLHKTGTQTVFGEGGGKKPKVVFIGEQPGDLEDKSGKPFVGPAGRMLDKALEELGIDRALIYVTNTVKHFKWVAQGKRRIHQKPNAREIHACRPWLDAELEVIKPKVIVCLGATAAQAVLGRAFKVTEQRGEFVESPLAPFVCATIHPSSILRAQSDDERHAQFEGFKKDLSIIKPLLT
jgi:uracil-DNA glycosylase